MNGIYHHIRSCGRILFWLTVVVCLNQRAEAQIGFQAGFETTTSWISPFTEPDYSFSAAILPKTKLILTRHLILKPKVVSSSFANNSLTFNSIFYRRGRDTWELVPISLDAQEYNKFSVDLYMRQQRDLMFRHQVAGLQKSKRGRGLGVSVALPKRLKKIFGEGGAGLQVSGFRKITLSGRSQWTDGQSNLLRQNKFPSLGMDQISRFDITGTIGTKITVKVSQDSQTDIPLANRIQIRYRGDEDDVLQSIEAGNTTLSLPNTQFVGYSARIRGLFGLKATAQIGSLKLTAIASQEKGNAEKASFTASGDQTATFIRDFQYADGRIFDLGLDTVTLVDTANNTAFFDQELFPGDKIIKLFVYEHETDRDKQSSTIPAIINVKPQIPNAAAAEDFRPPYGVNQLNYGTEFTYEQDIAKGIYYVVFNSRRLDSRALAVYMEVQRGDSIIKFGEINNVDTLNLKLIRSDNPLPSFATWKLMWRNVYDLRQRGANIEDLNIKVFKGLAGRETTTSSLDYQDADDESQPYIEILGLDQYTLNKKVSNGKVDDRSEIWRSDWGLLIFPSREPFNSDTIFVDERGDSTSPLDDKAPNLYNYVSPRGRSEASKYFIQIATKIRSSIIRLNRPNIIENSERLTLNGRLLKKGEDYNINYDFGQITLLSDEAVDPNAELLIDFEYTGFLAVQKKSLLGFRAEYEWSKNLQFGTTILYKSDRAQQRKPRVGQETSKMALIDFDASLKLHPNFLTKLANALPLVETSVPSALSISGEVARSYPNPNVGGEAFVDDFEAAIEQLTLSTSRTAWRHSALPVQVKDSIDSYTRGRLLWHTPTLGGDVTLVEDIYDRDVNRRQNIRTLRLIFKPDPINADSLTRSWAGITRYFRGRIDADRLQLFEFRARGTKGKLHFDFGSISEDVDGDGLADSEDSNPNGFVDESEDLGLDLIADPEPDSASRFWGTDGDPAGDNFYFRGEGKCPYADQGTCDAINWDDPNNYYRWLNGTEGNIRDAEYLGIPDEEALSPQGFKDLNSYFSFVVDLENTPFLVPNTAWPPTAAESRQFNTYRIPILEPQSIAPDLYSIEGNITPDWANISHVRIWFESALGDTLEDTVEVANWYFVQSNWQDSVIIVQSNLLLDDTLKTSFLVAQISEEDNVEFRNNPPPGVEQYVDPTTNVAEPRGGLLLGFPILQKGDTCFATKNLFTVDRYSGYGKMRMYVYGGIDDSLTTDTQDSIVFFFRLGTNSENFYEFHTKLYPRWDERNWVLLDFDEVTAFKDSVQKLIPREQRNKSVDISNDKYRVFGDPNLNEILFFSAGLVSTFKDPVKGEVWLDELRVTDVRKNVGTAVRLSASGNIADLINYNFQVQSRDAFFRGLSTATRGGSNNNLGSGRTSTTYSFGWSMNANKFLPPSWGARLPISYRFTKSITTPLLRTRSDVVLPEEVRQEERTISQTQTFSISEKFNKKGSNPLFNLFLNRQSVSFSYSRTEGSSVNSPFTFGENYNIKSGFDLGITKIPTAPIFFWTKWIPFAKKLSGSRLSLYPKSWRLSAAYSRTLRITEDINRNLTSSASRDFSGGIDVRYNFFDNLTTSFNYSTKRDLTDVNNINIVLSPKTFKLGIETTYRQRFNLKYDPKLLSWLTGTYSFDATYTDNLDRSSQTRRSTLTQGWGMGGTFNHRALFSKSAQSGGSRRGFRQRGGRRTINVPDDETSKGKKDDQNKDEKEQDKKQEDKNKKDGPSIFSSLASKPKALLRFLTGWIEPVNYNYNRGFNNFVPGMLERPGFIYRFGIDRALDVPIRSGDNRAASSGESQSYSLSSGFGLFGGIQTTVKFSRSENLDLVKQGPRYRTRTTSWPDLSIRISKFKSLPLIKGLVNKMIGIFSPRTGFSRREQETRDIVSGFNVTKSTSSSFSPLLSINFKLWRSLSLSGSYTYSTEELVKRSTGDGQFQSITNSNRRTIAATTKYTFSSPGGIRIPIFGRLKFTSTVNIDLTFKYSASISRTSKSESGDDERVSQDKSDFSVRPTISYSFSRQIRGGLSGSWQDTNDANSGRKSHVRQIQIWMEIRF